MSVESAKSAGNAKSSSDSSKEKKENKKKPPKPRRQPRLELPLLVDLSYTLPIIVILMVDFAIIGFSYSAGTDWVTTLSRAMVATVVLGSLLAIIAYVISSTALAGTKDRLEKEKARREMESQKALEALVAQDALENETTEIRA
jgi:hypothetical protein